MIDRLHNIFSVAVLFLLSISVSFLCVITIGHWMNPEPTVVAEFTCEDSLDEELLHTVSDLDSVQQLEFWREFADDLPGKLVTSDAWIIPESICRLATLEKGRFVKIPYEFLYVSYKNLKYPVVIRAGELKSRAFERELPGYDRYRSKDFRERIQLGFLGVLVSFVLWIFSYLFFGGIKVKFWRT